MRPKVIKCDVCGTLFEGDRENAHGWISISATRSYGITIYKQVKKGFRSVQERREVSDLDFCSGKCFSKYFTEI